MDLNISKRLILGFGILVVVLAGAVGTTLWKVSEINENSIRVVELRMPTAQASSHMVNNINASLAALRGYMLTGNPGFKKGRAEVWESIAEVRADMDKLSKTWTVPANIKKWSEFKVVLDEFAIAQAKVEAVAKTVDEQPATKILVNDAAPLAGVMVANISKMIDLELAGKGGTSGDRVQVLGMMADTRGTLGLGLANIRAYLLTGQQKFADNFVKLWKKNDRRFGDLMNAKPLLSGEQATLLDEFAAKRKNFTTLPPKMFAIRGSKKWNMANYTLVSEAAPRAGKLLNTLLGERDETGKRQGGMVANQQKLLDTDAINNEHAVTQLLTIEWIVLAVGLGIACVVGFFTIRSIVDPINAMTEAMGSLAQGQLETTVPALENTDEIGQMAQAVQVFKENGIEMKRLEAEQVEAAKRAEAEKKEMMNAMADDFESAVGGVVQGVSSAATEMQSSAQTMSQTADGASERASAVAAAAEEASTNVQTVASAAEELSSSISEISRQVQKSTEIASGAVKDAQQTDQQIQGLAKASQKISEVVGLITDIADQTNLLALNATIEAARAGDAGKGFAVVASEVKNLANQTAKATEEISSQIGDIQGATLNAVTAIQGIGKTIGEISEIAATIAAAVEEQGAATQEIARNVEQASAGTTEVTTNIAGVGEAVAETGHGATEVLSAASELSQQSTTLKVEVDKFLDQIRMG